MRLTDTLEQLAAEITKTAELKALAGPEALGRWAELVRQIRAEARVEWLNETEFKRRTGVSGKWCRKHFEDCETAGVARMRGARREWHVSARPPRRPHASDKDGLVEFIATSYQKQAA